MSRKEFFEKGSKFIKPYSSETSKAQSIFSFYSPKGVDQQAFDHYLLLAEKGDAKAQNKLGACFEKGKGTAQNLELAIFYYRQAADQGNNPALYNLARCYEEGIGVERSFQEAFKLYKKAADQGYAWAQSKMGFYYRWGRGVEKSLEEAIEYFSLALKGDYSDKEYLEDNIYECKKELAQSLAESKRKAYYAKAKQIKVSLPTQDIFYPGAQKLDTSRYTQNRQLEVLRQIFEESKDKPIFLYGSGLSYEEMIVVRDAMLENPRFTFICHRPDTYSLCEAFHRLGYYESCLKKRQVASQDDHKWYGFLFVG